jgi:hypothetical protein
MGRLDCGRWVNTELSSPGVPRAGGSVMARLVPAWGPGGGGRGGAGVGRTACTTT